MRAVILSEIDGALKKLVWVEECKGGIYMGFYGSANKMHFSYHQDGTVHMKSGSQYLPMYKTTPIQDIKNFVSLHNYGITLEKGYEFAASDYKNSKGANSVIYINPDIIRRKRILNIVSYIIQKNKEEECLRCLKESYINSKDGQTFEVISANFFKLDRFCNYLVGIMLVGGSWSSPEKDLQGEDR